MGTPDCTADECELLNRFLFFILPGDKKENQSKWADHYPQEILDLSWSNTSEQIVKDGYKIWAAEYEKVCVKFYWFKSGFALSRLRFIV